MKSYFLIPALFISQSLCVSQTLYGASLSGSVATVNPSAGGSSFSLTTSPSETWTTASTAVWLTPSPAAGTGSAVITYTWTANTSVNARQARIDVAGQSFYAVQPGAGGNYTWWASPRFGNIISIAGTGVAGSTGDGAAANAAKLNQPAGVAVDGNGNVYIADEFEQKIRRVDAVTGLISTVAGTGASGFSGDGALAVNATLKTPVAVTLDLLGNIYIADSGNYRIRSIDHLTGIITTVAGNGTTTYGGDGANAVSAGIGYANGLASDGSGNLYIADGFSRIRRVDAISGIITTVAGNGTAGLSGDGGLATSASLSSPHQIALDAAGDLYIADSFNSRVRRVDAGTGGITTVAGGGSGGDGGPAAAAALSEPWSVALDLAGNLYIGDQSARVRRVDAVTGIITTVAGGNYGSTGDGGPALGASFNSPYGLATDASGSVYIADQGNNRVRFVDFASPQISLAASLVDLGAGAGNGSTTFTINPSGAFWTATSSAGWLTLTAGSGNGSGSIAYSYSANNSVTTRSAAISIEGQVLQVIQSGATVAISASSAQAQAAGDTGGFGLTVSPSTPWTAVSSASWLTVSPAGGSSNSALTWTAAANTGTDARSATIIVGGKTFTVLQLSATGVYTPWAGTANGQIRTIAGGGTGGDNIAATQSLLGVPRGIALDANNNLFIADTGLNKIRRVDAATGIITTVAGTGTAGFGGDGAAATSALLNGPQGIAVIGQVIYVTDTGNNRIRMIDASGNITTIVGTGGQISSGDGGPAAAAGVNAPRGITADTAGNLFFADTGGQRVRRIDAVTGTIVTVAGTGAAGYAGDGGPATAALLYNPTGLAVDKAGNLFIADAANVRIRRVDVVTGLISTVAGNGNGNCCNAIGDNGPAVNASLSSPSGVTIDPAGNLIVADTGNDRIRRIDSSGTIETIAGTGGCCFGDGGPALLAGLSPLAIVADGIGNLYVIDGSKVRFIDFTTPSVTLPAPNLAAAQVGGTGSIAMTILPSGAFWGAVSNASWLTVTTPSGSGNATIGYSFSLNNSVVPRAATITIAGRVMVVTQAGAMASLSGHSVTVGAPAGSATFSLTLSAAVPWTTASSATWLTVTPAGGTGSATLTYSWTANTGTAARMAAITVAGQSFSVLQGGASQVFSIRNGNGRGTIQTIAGNGQYGSAGDGGPANSAELTPGKSVIDANGNVFVIDTYSARVRRIDVVTGTISTVAGTGSNTFSGDGGLATSASLNNPRGIALDVSGNLFIADTGNYRIRRVDAVTGIITTVAGIGSNGGYTGDGGPATSATLNSPVDVAVDGNGALFIADNSIYRILRVDPASGAITTVGGTGTYGSTGNGGPATQAQLSTASISLDAAGDIFLLDQGASFPSVRRVSALTGIISIVAGSVGGSTPALSLNFFQLSTIAADPLGNLYLNNSGPVYRVDTVTGSLTIVAGIAFTNGSSGDGGPALLAAISPQKLSLDGAGNLYTSENARLRYIDFSTPQAIVTPLTVSTGAAAGTGQVTIAVAPANISWTAVSSVPWLSLTSSTGTGTATLNYSFTANSTFATRTGLITVFGQSLVVTQTGVSASVVPPAVTVSLTAGSGAFSLTAGSGASWTASASASWLTPTPLSGNGSTTVGYSFTANASQSPRTASITVAGQTLTVLQLGNTDQYSVWGSGGNGTIVTVAGNGGNGFSGDGGLAVNANLGNVTGVAVDAGNRIYIADSNNNRIRMVDPAAGIINTIAGVGTTGFSGDGGQAMSTKLSVPDGVAVDAAGNVYIADTQNNRIRRIDAVSGLISTVAGTGTVGFSGDGGRATSANLYSPNGVALDAADNIYIADTGNNAIRRVDAATGVIDTIAGTGLAGFSGDNGPASQAQLSQPYGLALDSAGNVFIADSQNYRVRRVSATTGMIATIAGMGNSGFSGDSGPATAAALSSVSGVAVDAAGNLYLTDTGNSRVRRVDAVTGIIATVAGNGICCAAAGDGGPALLAAVNAPRGIAVTSNGLYFTDASSRVRFVDLASPVVTASTPVVTVANSAGTGSVNVTLSSAGALWLATSNASWLSLTSAGGTGTGSVAFTFTANNSISPRVGVITIFNTTITVKQPGVTVTLSPGSAVVGPPAGVLHVTMTMSVQVPWTATSSATWLTPNFAGGTGNAVISWTYTANSSKYGRIATLQIGGKTFAVTQAGTASYTPWGTFGNGIIGTIAGGGGSQAMLSNPYSVAVDGNGDLFIGEFSRILRVDAITGATTTVAGTGNCCGTNGDGGPATSAAISYPYGMAVDTAGNLYFSDTYNSEVRRVDAVTGIITKIAGGGSSANVAADGGPATAAILNSPHSLVLDNAGTLYISESNRVRAVNLTTGIISTYAGSATPGFGGDGGPATQALLNFSGNLTMDGAGNLFIYDNYNYRIRRVDANTQNISTIAGTGCCGAFSGDGGPAAQASISSGGSLAVDALGNIYISDSANFRIRRVNAGSGIITTIAGTGATSSTGDGGLATAASLLQPGVTTLDASGNLYFIEGNPASHVRFIDYATPLPAQTIAFAALSNVAAGTASVALSATASSGLTVSFTSGTPAVCTVSGTTVTILISGGCSITATQAGNASYSAAPPITQSFTILFGDVAPTDHYYAAINAMAQLGITAGCGSNNYCATQNVTRDQMAIFIVRAIYGNDNFAYNPAPYFTDVTPSTFGFKWIQKMKDLGITNGCTATTYCPLDTVSRDQMAIFIIRARLGLALAGGQNPTFTYPTTPYFTDVAPGAFGFAWIQRMREESITSGCTATTYCSSDPIVRGDMAIFLMRGAFNQFLPAGTPVVSQISPSTLGLGTTQTYTITGTNTTFVQGSTTLSPIPGVTIGAITVTSPTTLTVQLTAASNAVAQPYSILAITGSQEAVLPNGLLLQ